MIHTILRTALAIAGTLLALAIAAPTEAAKFTINIDDAGTCSGSWQTTGSAVNPTVSCVLAGSGTPAPAPTPAPTPAPAPAAGGCNGYNVVDLGDITFNGHRITTSGVSGLAVVVGRIVVPNPLPPGWAGNVATIAVYEYSDPQRSKKMYLTPSPCDFTNSNWPFYSEGNSPSVQASFQEPMPGAVPMEPGDIWYLTVKNERSANGAASCPLGRNCNFAITLSAPSPN